MLLANSAKSLTPVKLYDQNETKGVSYSSDSELSEERYG
jgi:hypothetical protein